MKKEEFYKEQLTKDTDFYTIEITEIETKKVGVAYMLLDDKDERVTCFYGREDGEDDCVIPFNEFMKRFTIDRVIDDENNNAYKVIVNGNDYQLEKE